MALKAARVLLFPRHHGFAPPGSWGCASTHPWRPATSPGAMEIPSLSFKIIYVFRAAVCWLIEESRVLLGRWNYITTKLGDMAQGLLQLESFLPFRLVCLWQSSSGFRTASPFLRLGVFDTGPGERNQTCKSRFCKNCMYAGQAESQCHQALWSIP